VLLRLTLAVALLTLAPAAARAEEPLPPQGTPPPGANDFACKPPPRHPYPVVLVHGTYLNMTNSWTALAPALERLGYCVFALDYGNGPVPGVNGVGDIPKSAGQLETFVDKVLHDTGAAKVSIVGHSQGGMMPRYLIRFLGGADEVDDLVGLSPSNHGTTNPLAGPAGQNGCPACTQQIAGSAFLQALNEGDQTPPPASYTVVETMNDEVVTPYDSEFLPQPADGRVTNVLLQDACPTDQVEHIGITSDPVALQWALNALGRPGPADRKFKPDCSGAALASFPDSNSVAPASGGSTPPVRLVIGHVFHHARATNGRRLRAAVSSRNGAVHRVRLTVLHGKKTLGRSKRVTISKRRGVVVRLRRPLRPGRYTLRAIGAEARAVRHFTLR
jgi:triacylglycerol esterase/lipase EstA (alpha/beta hydrolase family)